VLAIDTDSFKLIKTAIVADIISLVEDEINFDILTSAAVQDLVLVYQVVKSLIPDPSGTHFMGALGRRPGLVDIILAFESLSCLTLLRDGLLLVTTYVNDDLLWNSNTLPGSVVVNPYVEVERELEYALSLLLALHEVIC